MTKDSWFKLSIGVLGLVTGLLPYLSIFDYIINHDTPNFSGKWTAEYKEWCVKGDPGCPESSRWIKTVQAVTISQWGSLVSGSAENTEPSFEGPFRFKGSYRTPILAVTYLGPPGAPGAGAVVLTTGREQEPMAGYWTGYDRDRGVMTCPYVLVWGDIGPQDIEKKQEGRLQQWLGQACSLASGIN